MEFSWTILAVVVLANSLWMVMMFVAQQLDKSLPPRGSVIPGTQQKFLYFQDFHTMTWGDMIGIPLVANSFVHLATNGFIGSWQWLIFAVIAVVDAWGFRRMCVGQNHKPDMGFPEIGKVSWIGFLHLPYHGVGVAMSVLAIWHFIAGDLRCPVFYVALAGGAIYIASFIVDIVVGNFKSLKRI